MNRGIARYWNDIRAIRGATGISLKQARWIWREIVTEGGGTRREITRETIVKNATRVGGDLGYDEGGRVPLPATGAFRKYVDAYDTPDGRRDLIVFVRGIAGARYAKTSGQSVYQFPVNVGRFTRKEADGYTNAELLDMARSKMHSADMRRSKLSIVGKGWLKDREDREGIRLTGKGSRGGNRRGRKRNRSNRPGRV